MFIQRFLLNFSLVKTKATCWFFGVFQKKENIMNDECKCCGKKLEDNECPNWCDMCPDGEVLIGMGDPCIFPAA